MKHLYSFLAGALTISLCVVASNAQPGWMLLLGGILGAITVSVSRRNLHARRGEAGARGAELPPQLHLRERLSTATDAPKVRRAPTTKKKRCTRHKKNVQSPMLRPIQQDVLSALTNLKVPYDEALKAVLSAHPGDSFDDLFRSAMAGLTVKTRRAAA